MALKELPIHPLEFTEYPEQLIQRLIAQYGDAFAYESGHGLVYVFNHPDQVDAINRSANFVRTAVMTGFLGYGLLTRAWNARIKQASSHQTIGICECPMDYQRGVQKPLSCRNFRAGRTHSISRYARHVAKPL